MSKKQETTVRLELSPPQRELYLQVIGKAFTEGKLTDDVSALKNMLSSNVKSFEVPLDQIGLLGTLVRSSHIPSSKRKSQKAIIQKLEKMKCVRSSPVGTKAVQETEKTQLDMARQATRNLMVQAHENADCATPENQKSAAAIYDFVRTIVIDDLEMFEALVTDEEGEYIIAPPRQHIDHPDYYTCYHVLKYLCHHQVDNEGNKIPSLSSSVIQRHAMASCYGIEHNMTAREYREALKKHHLGRGNSKTNGLACKFRKEHEEKFAAASDKRKQKQDDKVALLRNEERIVCLPSSLNLPRINEERFFVTISTEDGWARKSFEVPILQNGALLKLLDKCTAIVPEEKGTLSVEGENIIVAGNKNIDVTTLIQTLAQAVAK